jgi:hypothetical protein
MRNHHHKSNDIARSALASSLTVSGRGRRYIHKSERARERVLLHQARRSTGADAPELSDDAIRTWRMASLVGRRRGHDKLGPLLRWAASTLAAHPELQGLPYREQTKYFRGLLGEDLASRHALLHIEFFLLQQEYKARRIQAQRPEQLDKLDDALAVIVAAGAIGVLNRSLKSAFNRGPSDGASQVQVPLLYGAHDVARFQDVIAKQPTARRVVVDLAARLTS